MIHIGPLQVDVERREVFLDGQPVRLGSRAFDMLAVLISANGGLVSKNEMLKQVWPNAIVEENNLQVHMSALRKMLGESRGLIQTVSGRGYRLVPRVSSTAASGNAEDDDPLDDVMQGARVPHNLPVNLSALIGRDRALDDVSLALASARHVTLVGSGGIGKTRLAVEVARTVAARAGGSPEPSFGRKLLGLAQASNSVPFGRAARPRRISRTKLPEEGSQQRSSCSACAQSAAA